MKRLKIALRLLGQGRIDVVILRLVRLVKEKLAHPPSVSHATVDIAIMTPPHTLLLANVLARSLSNLGFRASISSEKNVLPKADLTFVIAPQFFTALPPGERRIVFNVEQIGTSNKYHSDEYFRILENSLAVADYSEANLPLLRQRGIAYPHVFVIPPAGDLSLLDHYGKASGRRKKRIIYGDFWSSSRRMSLLDSIRSRTGWTFLNNNFGDQLWDELSNHQAVVNYHYFDEAILESIRVLESLSCGCRVISEASRHNELDPGVMRFVREIETGSATDFVSEAERMTTPFTEDEIKELRSVLLETEKRFDFALKRMLLALDLVPNSVLDVSGFPKDFSKPICLSLPETFERRHLAKSSLPQDFTFFDGLRHKEGWKGCGLSYQHLAQAAINAEIESVTICEDDVLLPSEFDSAYSTILDYLSHRSDSWDVYAGLIADLNPKARVIQIEEWRGVRFVTLDTMTSTVFNIYNRGVLKEMANWNPDAGPAATNTIDRFLESRSRIRVVTSPDIVFGHRADSESTLWGFGNETYNPMISASRSRLLQLVVDFEASGNERRGASPSEDSFG